MPSQAIRLIVYGRVQGVGFRPSVCRLANKYHGQGLVRNLGNGVEILFRGQEDDVRAFEAALGQLKRPVFIERQERQILGQEEFLQLCPGAGFVAVLSREKVTGRTFFPGDLAMCQDCAAELGDQSNYRYHYPYISCAQCGPRYTIMRKLPYDRENTTMDVFPLCGRCYGEYVDMANRRGKGETIACHECGPQLSGYVRDNKTPLQSEEALQAARVLLDRGEIIMVKSLGGFNLVCRADQGEAVGCLRHLKRRPSKPFAVMAKDLKQVRQLCCAGPQEEELLQSPVRPIVLLRKREPVPVLAANVSFGTAYLGVFLPPMGFYALLVEAGAPLVVTSCNYSGQPILLADGEGEKFFASNRVIAGLFTYNREILRPADDSVMQVAAGKTMVLRRTRGFLPEPVSSGQQLAVSGQQLAVSSQRSADSGQQLAVSGQRSADSGQQSAVSGQPFPIPYSLLSTLYSLSPTPYPLLPTLGVGAQMEPGFCLGQGQSFYLAQVPGHAEEAATEGEWLAREQDWEDFLHLQPGVVVGDLHPNYDCTRWGKILAQKSGIPFLPIQHHYAHALSVMGEHGLQGKTLAVIFDGTGYGRDGSIWGGEFLLCRGTEFCRVAHVRSTDLPGGDVSMGQGWKTAYAYLYEAGLPLPQDEEGILVRLALTKKINVVPNSSLGRLFDAAAYLLGLGKKNTHQGCLAQRVEEAAVRALERNLQPVAMGFTWGADGAYSPDRIICALAQTDVSNRDAVSRAALGFHYAVVEMVVQVAEQVRQKQGVRQIVLGGGCFVNRVLLGKCYEDLRKLGFQVYFNEQVSPGDGGLALGQAYYGQLWQEERNVCGVSGESFKN